MFEKALGLVRNQPGVGSVWWGVDYDDMFIFLISANQKVIPDDPTTCYAIVKDDSVVFAKLDIDEYVDEDDFYENLESTRFLIDATESDL